MYKLFVLVVALVVLAYDVASWQYAGFYAMGHKILGAGAAWPRWWLAYVFQALVLVFFFIAAAGRDRTNAGDHGW